MELTASVITLSVICQWYADGVVSTFSLSFVYGVSM